jgi:ABC-type molybdate transport system substrate-binding protein
MKITTYKALFILNFTLAIFTTNSFAQNNKERFLTIFAENETALSLIKVTRKYSQENNVTISINFDNSADLIKEIEDGEPAGIFISSHPQWTQELKNKGLIDYKNFLDLYDKKLLLVTSKINNKFNYAEIAETKNIYKLLKFINQKKLPIIYDHPKSSIGLYFSNILQKTRLNKTRIYQKIDEDSKTISDILVNNIEYFSIISESLLESHMQIVKEISDIQIKRQILIIAGNEMEEAKKFINYLRDNNINF